MTAKTTQGTKFLIYFAFQMNNLVILLQVVQDNYA